MDEQKGDIAGKPAPAGAELIRNEGVEPQPEQVRRRLKLLITITTRGRGKEVQEICTRVCNTVHLSLMGRGTAKSEILDYLGLGETQKDVILTVVRESCLKEVMDALQNEMKFHEHGNGIMFTIPITSVGGPVSLRFISGMFESMMENAEKRGENNG